MKEFEITLKIKKTNEVEVFESIWNKETGKWDKYDTRLFVLIHNYEFIAKYLEYLQIKNYNELQN